MLTGFLICAHHWSNVKPAGEHRRLAPLAPTQPHPHPAGTAFSSYSASRVFAAVYPEAVSIAALIGSPAWRVLAAGDPDQKTKFYAEIGRRLGVPDDQPDPNADAVAHWAHFHSWPSHEASAGSRTSPWLLRRPTSWTIARWRDLVGETGGVASTLPCRPVPSNVL